jgi:multiple sugar transport system ATP-binding protein
MRRGSGGSTRSAARRCRGRRWCIPRYEIVNLSKRFGRITALSGITLSTGEGEFTVVLGPTGAGKTTLLRLICGLDRPDGGSIRADGQDVSSLPPPERDMAMVFQNFSLYPRLSVYENLAFPLRPRWRRMTRQQIESRVRWAAELLGLTDKLEQMPAQLSGGQQQRVAIGRAIVREPQLFLFDEPLASLDAKLREQMSVEIHRLQRRLNVAMLYVTHDQVEAMSLADRIVVLDGGSVLQVGTPDEVYRRPVSARVARMLGSPPVNLLEGAQATRLGLPSARTVGVRPEHIRLLPNTSGIARTVVVEHLGPTTTVLLEVQGLRLRATVKPTHPVTFGDGFDIHVDPQHVMTWD